MCESARVTEDALVCSHLAFNLALTHVSNDLCSLTMWKFAVVVPEIKVSTYPSLGSTEHTVQDVNLTASLLARK